MGANDTLRVDPQVMRGFAESLGGVVEDLRERLAELDGQVGEMLGGWRGASGSAYTSAWEQWHRGAGEVHAGLAIFARLIDEAEAVYGANEANSAQALREVYRG
jgi:WXG100 family type VII secretion target